MGIEGAPSWERADACVGVTLTNPRVLLLGFRLERQAVYAGKSGSVPANVLVVITDELLAKERAEKEAQAEEYRKKKEAEL